MKQNLKIAILMTLVTTVLLGIIYPLVVTGLAQVMFHDKANGQLITRHGEIVGSRIIGQAFAGSGYLHSRPSAAGNGYDASNSGGSNYAPTNAALVSRVAATVQTLNPKGTSAPVPIDLATASGSGLDPDITPAAAYYQVTRVAAERHIGEDAVRNLVAAHVTPRQFGLLGEPRVNVLQLNMDLDAMAPPAAAK